MIFIKALFKKLSVVYLVFCISIFSCITFLDYKLPNRYMVNENDDFKLTQSYLKVDNSSINTPVSSDISNYTKTINLFGIIPIKNVSIKTNEQINLIPSGNQFGIKMFTTGAMVVGMTQIQTDNGLVCPAKDAGISEGDIVTSINGKSISRNEDIAEIIENSQGQSLNITLERENEQKQVSLTPVLSSQDNKYKSGLWVRDSAAGIGTITYIDPANNSFAGLGHAICDVDTGEIMPVGSGEICNVSIHNIKKGKAGTPGELMGAFTNDSPIGCVKNNNQTGIYGALFESHNTEKTYPLAYKQEVKIGDATILCALKDETPQEYNIKITSIDYNPKTQVKNMTVKVTDEKLIEKTGGIVQGMSGTPIIQNGKIIGAITHVFVNDSKKGYAIFAENMYNYSSQINK